MMSEAGLVAYWARSEGYPSTGAASGVACEAKAGPALNSWGIVGVPPPAIPARLSAAAPAHGSNADDGGNLGGVAGGGGWVPGGNCHGCASGPGALPDCCD